MKAFYVKDEHLKLLKGTHISWQDCEFGAPEINPKRPYGNSDVYTDIAEILDIKPDRVDDWGEESFSREQLDYMFDLHKDLETVLQILVELQEISPGLYDSIGYGTNWRKVNGQSVHENNSQAN